MAEDEKPKGEVPQEPGANYQMDEDSGSALATMSPEDQIAVRAGQRNWTDTDDMEEDEELFFPRLRLASGQSESVRAGDARPGDLFLDDHGVIALPYTFYPMATSRGRVRRVRKDPTDPNSEQELKCRSSNAVYGVGEPGGQCSLCPFLKNGCGLIRSYVCYDPGLDLIFQWDLQGTGLRTANQVSTIKKQPGFQDRYGTFGVTITGTKEAGSGQRRYFVYQMKGEPMPEGVVLPPLFDAQAAGGEPEAQPAETLTNE